jgi:hypothetical protein
MTLKTRNTHRMEEQTIQRKTQSEDFRNDSEGGFGRDWWESSL